MFFMIAAASQGRCRMDKAGGSKEMPQAIFSFIKYLVLPETCESLGMLQELNA